VTRKQRRLVLIGVAGLVLAAAAGLVLTALQSQITFFATPSDIVAKSVQPGQRLRLGGLVEAGSVKRDNETTRIDFRVTDTSQTIPVTYSGIVPDLFREGQGVVAEGTIDSAGVFRADSLLARHDENYMPKEVADALKAQGHWVDGANYGKKP
jgi:cytochrome c-type biogenesis protein CcmE